MKLERILYADDEPDIQSVVKLALEVLGGYEVLLCGNGAEALAQVSCFNPNLILLDVMMPSMDGLTTLQWLQGDARTASIPVIFLTAKAQAHEIKRYQALGALSVITKPFDPMTIAAAIQKIWNQTHE